MIGPTEYMEREIMEIVGFQYIRMLEESSFFIRDG